MFATLLPSLWRGLRCITVTSWPACRSSFTSAWPMNRVPPITRTFRLAGSWRLDPLVVVLEPKMCNQILSAHPTQRVLQLHQLNENVVLGIQPGSRHGSFEVEGQPLLNAFHARPLRQIQEKNQIQHQRSGQDGIAAQEVDFDLHGITKPSENVDV